MAKANNAIGFYDRRYKVVLHEIALNKLLADRIVSETPELELFRIHFHEKFALVQGIVALPEENPKVFGARKLGFKLLLFADELSDNKAVFRVKKFSLYNATRKRVDWLKVYSRLSNRIQESLVRIFGELKTPITFSDDLRHMTVDMNGFAQNLDSLKPLIGQVILDFCFFTGGRLVFLAHSNVILRSLIELFGPDFISVEEVDPDADVLNLLWSPE